MKTCLILFSILFVLFPLTAQPLQKGNIVGIHHLKIDLKSGVTLEEYINFWDHIVLPAYRAQMEGAHIETAYGLRGDCKACLGMMIVLESEDVRNRYWKADGSWTDYGMKKLERINFVFEELTSNYGSFSSTHTDWIIDPDWSTSDMDLLEATAKGPASIRGTWALIHGVYSGKVRQPAGEVFQYKLFDDDHFSLNMKTPKGQWDRSAVGKYSLDGDTYIETFLQSSDDGLAGATAKWNYRMVGDTLHMEGPTMIVDKDGKPAFPDLLNSMQEIRIRID